RTRRHTFAEACDGSDGGFAPQNAANPLCRGRPRHCPRPSPGGVGGGRSGLQNKLSCASAVQVPETVRSGSCTVHCAFTLFPWHAVNASGGGVCRCAPPGPMGGWPGRQKRFCCSSAAHVPSTVREPSCTEHASAVFFPEQALYASAGGAGRGCATAAAPMPQDEA